VPDDRDTFTITFDGDPVAVVAGQTIAAALIASGRASWRTTRGRDEPRGLFCGIGACFDCLVTVNGSRAARACLVPASPGDVVASERGDHADLTA
jgi:predicted molibdopterin-dependent oxidoreductase YjgC